MKFTIITHAIHKIKGEDIFAYEPYVREMNLWSKGVDELRIVAPISMSSIEPIESKYLHNSIKINRIPSINLVNIKNICKSLIYSPFIIYQIVKAMIWAEHIHLRCPGNIGLLGCLVQIFFPNKTKTVKYAGNWDPKSKQPLSYRIQKFILNNTFLTKNCKVLVYGDWKNQSKNIIPFFTASFHESEISEIRKPLMDPINLIYVGAFTKSKQPKLSVLVAEKLIEKGYNIQLNMYGDGEQFISLKKYVNEKKLETNIILYGNKSKEVVKEAFKNSHFLIFISKSEGWPKVVAEAMFWSCFAISSKVSCVPFMLDNGERGTLVDGTLDEVVNDIIYQIKNPDNYNEIITRAKKWSQQYTIEYFEKEILKLI